MNGAHDLGGKHGFGRVDRSQQSNFAAPWEERVFGLTLACGMLGQWNLDEARFARENTDPAHYLNSSYYEHWLHGLETLLVEKGLLGADELAAHKALSGATVSAVGTAQIPGILASGGPTLMECQRPARFTAGEQVRVVADVPRSHTRAPGYVKGRIGRIAGHHGAHIFADEHARSAIKEPEYLYSVEFLASELWGAEAAEPQNLVMVDLFEPYLALHVGEQTI